MNDKEIKILLMFLDELGDRFGNDGCNDWNFPSDWTKEEKIKFNKEFWTLNGSPEEFDEKHLHMMNTMVLELLKKKLMQHFKEVDANFNSILSD